MPMGQLCCSAVWNGFLPAVPLVSPTSVVTMALAQQVCNWVGFRALRPCPKPYPTRDRRPCGRWTASLTPCQPSTSSRSCCHCWTSMVRSCWWACPRSRTLLPLAACSSAGACLIPTASVSRYLASRTVLPPAPRTSACARPALQHQEQAHYAFVGLFAHCETGSVRL